MSNRLNSKAIEKINRIRANHDTWLQAAEWLLLQNGKPTKAAASVASLMNQAANGKIQSSPRLVKLLGMKRKQYRLAVSFESKEKQTAVMEWVESQGYSSFSEWFHQEIWQKQAE